MDAPWIGSAGRIKTPPTRAAPQVAQDDSQPQSRGVRAELAAQTERDVRALTAGMEAMNARSQAAKDQQVAAMLRQYLAEAPEERAAAGYQEEEA